jgi:hypothetical protein
MVINSFVMSSPFVYIYYSTFMLAWQKKTGTLEGNPFCS